MARYLHVPLYTCGALPYTTTSNTENPQIWQHGLGSAAIAEVSTAGASSNLAQTAGCIEPSPRATSSM
ncbi:unnamed protein product, partial [Mycena citricolor]